MGKAKKVRKGGKGDVSDSEEEITTTTSEFTEKVMLHVSLRIVKQSCEVDEGEIKKDKSKSKKSKQEDSDSEEDTEVVSKVQKSFALLQVEDEDAEENQNELESESDKEVKPKKKSNKDSERTKESGKKGKKGRRKKEDSDEDIEKVLAELEREYAGIKDEKEETPPKPIEITEDQDQPEKKSKKKKKEKQQIEETNEDSKQEDGENEEGIHIKTAAQKKKEKKEREKQKKLTAKKIVKTDEGGDDEKNTEAKASVTKEEHTEDVEAQLEGEKDSKKKKKKGAKDEKESKEVKKGPGKKTIAAMQEALLKIKEEEERLKREEEERMKREEEAEKARLEALRLEQERKERKKQKEKERKERLKAEGKLLTPKQKADRARAQALIDSLKAQGVELPDVGTKKPRPGTRIKPNKQKSQPKEEKTPEVEPTQIEEANSVKVEIVEKPVEIVEPQPEPEDDVKDAWDESSGEEEDDSEETPAEDTKKTETLKKEEQSKKDQSDDESSSSASETEDSESEEDSGEDDDRTPAQKARDKALERIKLRKEAAEKNKSVDNLRAAIVCVLGHVDTGKTKILDKLRRTNVQDGEAGGITQQIGATNVPIDAIKEQIKIVKGASDMTLKIPGLLIIDTPGHESFSNLRNRGSSLCDIAILVVDIMHGLEPQTIESINILKKRKTPFIVALNKIDRLYDWNTMNRKDVRDILKAQSQNTQLEFEKRSKEVIVQFAEQGLNAALFYENPDIRSYVSLVPTSAITGEGMGNLLALIVEFCQTRLPQRLMYSDELQATVLEVKAIPGLGTTIDVILVNGTLREGDTMLCAGTDGPIVTQIRSLLMPQPMKELRVKNAYIEYREIKAAQGVKIAAKELEKAIAGLNLYIANKPDEVELLKEDVARELKSALSNIKLQERGVYVQASTLGSLEALLEFLRTSKIPVMKERDKAFKKMRTFPDAEQNMSFKEINKQLKNLIKKNKKMHMESKFTLVETDDKKKWDLIKNVIHLEANKSEVEVILDNKVINNP
ncbi:hypothetical protein HHI36_010776 [Cryptolaemus montrouzieri]|uniref:Tr-type G domain-containing protein n=1 Tax=Cryptolaemus montrouzieri TaxID=559131 RepID=A0ABD2MJV9_9CUCU